jgi:hypothetical protein
MFRNWVVIYYPAILLKNLVNRDFLRAAVFLCSTPLVTALSMVISARRNLIWASSLFSPAIASLKRRMAVRKLDLIRLLRSVRFLVMRTRLAADLIFGIFLTSQQRQFYHALIKKASFSRIRTFFLVNDKY